MARKKILSENTEEILNLLQAYIQSGNLSFLLGSGASMPAIQVAGNIEAEINKLIEDNNEEDANLLTISFIEEIEKKNDFLSLGVADKDTAQTLSWYTEFLSVLDRILFERKNHLLPRQANIFTTNYDLFIEHTASQLPSVVLNDGFDRTSSVTGDYGFAPERFFDRTYRSGSVYSRQSEVPTINLVKLHGSLTWKKGAAGIAYRHGHPTALTAKERNDASAVEKALRQRPIVLPNLKKYDTALMDRVYYDLLRIFANSMERENAVLISFGFSFSDAHILDITRRALRNPTSQLIIVAYDSAAAASSETKFSSERNALVIGPSKTSVSDFHKFTSLLEHVLPKHTNGHAKHTT